jgi:hypothetical protein
MAEIKISDLSIGDWVRHTFYEDNLQIKRIDGESERLLVEKGLMSVSCHLDHFEPIPLTPEILEKNGFERGEYSEIREYNEWEIGEWINPPYVSVKLDIDRQVIRVTNRGRDMFIADKEVYVHQLQHALRLAGVGKEIEV